METTPSGVAAAEDSVELDSFQVEGDVRPTVAAIEPHFVEVHTFRSGTRLLLRSKPGERLAYLLQDVDGAVRPAVYRQQQGKCYACDDEGGPAGQIVGGLSGAEIGPDNPWPMGGGIGGTGSGGSGNCVEIDCPEGTSGQATWQDQFIR